MHMAPLGAQHKRWRNTKTHTCTWRLAPKIFLHLWSASWPAWTCIAKIELRLLQEDLQPTDLTADKYGAPPIPEGLQSDSQFR